jgi:ABC-type transporter Mla subunit MlaD
MAGSGSVYASFPNVARLGGAHSREAADRLSRACQQLDEAGASSAARRIAGIDGQVGKSDFAIIEALANPGLAADELGGALQRRARRLHAWRNGLALFPLLLTWLALGLAGLAYEVELARHPSLSTKPFLLLWEQGFGSHIPFFLIVALLDFALLGVVLGLTILVHAAETQESVRESEILETLYTAMDFLEVALKEVALQAPNTAQEWAAASQRWAEAVERIIEGAMEETRQIAQTGQKAITDASKELAGIQEQGRQYLQVYSEEVRTTLAAVRSDNEQFINRTATEARETLQRLVEVQMEPLLRQLADMLVKFGQHQETYRAGVADLSTGVGGIRDAARELVTSAKAYDRTADALATSLTGIEAAQKDYAAKVASSAQSMATAATAMGGFQGSMSGLRDSTQQLAADITTAGGEVQRSVTDMRDSVRQMAADVTSASTDLEGVQRKLAGTSSSLDGTSGSLDTTTRSLKDTADALDRVARELRRFSGSGTSGGGRAPRRWYKPWTWR